METQTQDRVEARIVFPFWTAYLATLQIILRSPLQLAASAIFPAAGVYGVYLLVASHRWPGFGDAMTILGCFLLMPALTVLSLYLTRRRNPFTQGPFDYTFDAEGIHCSSPAFVGLIKWQSVSKVRESGTFLFFFTGPARAQCVPLAQLRAAGVLDDLRRLVVRHVRAGKSRQ